jgi:hypothetical protein
MRVVTLEGSFRNNVGSELTYRLRGFIRCVWCWAWVSPHIVLLQAAGCPNCGSTGWTRAEATVVRPPEV